MKDVSNHSQSSGTVGMREKKASQTCHWRKLPSVRHRIILDTVHIDLVDAESACASVHLLSLVQQRLLVDIHTEASATSITEPVVQISPVAQSRFPTIDTRGTQEH